MSPLPLLAQNLPSYQLEQHTFDIEAWRTFNGREIREVRIHGLKWTKENAVRLLLSQRAGDIFMAEVWVKGIHKLYNTTVIYDIRTDIQSDDDGKIGIDLWVGDRWTLLPFGIAQGGGGSTNFGVGIWDGNSFGYFTQLAASYNEFDSVGSYDFNLYQEFFLDTELMGGADISATGTPVSLQADNGQPLGSYTWLRHQQQLLIGRRFEPKIRLFSYFETFQDQMVDNSQTPEVQVYRENQYRIRPTMIWGRSDLTNYLEQGFELTVAPTFANFFTARRDYYQWVTTYKRTMISGNTNFAFFINTGAMTGAPIPYLFHLGGYDTVRGFSTNRAVGEFYVNYNLEYRPYLFTARFPLIDRVVFQGCLFQDMGNMWNSSNLAATGRVNSSIFLLSNGVGLRLNFLKFASAIVRLDVARTTVPDEGWGGGFGVGQFF